MNPKLLLCLALVLSGVLTGCVINREFRGSTANLKGGGGQTASTDFLKMTVAGSGITTKGGNYLVLALPEQHCQLAFFYPKMKPYPYYCLQAEISTNSNRVWQVEQSMRSTNYACVNVDLPEKQTGVWLIRGKQFNHSQLEPGSEGDLPVGAERLFGRIELDKDGSRFQIKADLASENGVQMSGIFDSYKRLWSPLVLPAAMMFSPEGPSWQHKYKPLPVLPETNNFQKP